MQQTEEGSSDLCFLISVKSRLDNAVLCLYEHLYLSDFKS